MCCLFATPKHKLAIAKFNIGQFTYYILFYRLATGCDEAQKSLFEGRMDTFYAFIQRGCTMPPKSWCSYIHSMVPFLEVLQYDPYLCSEVFVDPLPVLVPGTGLLIIMGATLGTEMLVKQD